MRGKLLFLYIGVLLLITAVTLSAQKLPKPVGFVNDFANVIDARSKAEMEGISRILQQKTGTEIAVATVQTIQPYSSVEEYSMELSTEWGIGGEGEDTGVLILLAIQERQIRLEIGYGLEGTIPDGLAGEIIDQSMLPSLRTGEYGTGLLRGVQAVAGIIAEEQGVEIGDYRLTESRRYTRRSFPTGLIMFIIFAFLFGGGRFLFWPLLFMGSAAGRRGFYGGGFGSGGTGIGGGFSGFSGGGFGGGGASRGF